MHRLPHTTVQSVSISCSTSGASIRYTTDGTDPIESSTLYLAPISLSNTTTLKARAFKTNYNHSLIATTVYTINLPTVATPTFSIASGTYTGTQINTISCSTTGASIRYTTNGTDPTESSTLYSSPLSIAVTTTLKAKAFKTNYNPSLTAPANYTIIPVPIWFDHFNNLSAWTNTTSGSGGAWYLDPDGYSGSCAVSNCMDGNGDQLTRSFNFSTNVVLKVWVLTEPNVSFSLSIKVDGVNVIEDNSVSEWTQRQVNISSGQHTISIETSGWSGWGYVDELEIYAN